MPRYETNNQLETIVPGLQSVIFPGAPRGWVIPGDPGIPSTIAPTRCRNVGPRFGFAYCQGPEMRSTALALKRAYDAMPAPKLVFAIGSCACGGGVWFGQLLCPWSRREGRPCELLHTGLPSTSGSDHLWCGRRTRTCRQENRSRRVQADGIPNSPVLPTGPATRWQHGSLREARKSLKHTVAIPFATIEPAGSSRFLQPLI